MGKVNPSTLYSVMNSTGPTQCFSTNHKMSSEQKNQSSFISDQSQMRDLRYTAKRFISINEKATKNVGCSFYHFQLYETFSVRMLVGKEDCPIQNNAHICKYFISWLDIITSFSSCFLATPILTMSSRFQKHY